MATLGSSGVSSASSLAIGRALATVVSGLTILVAGVPPAGAATPFAKGPYLQSLGPTGVTIKLELTAPGPVSVEVSADGASDDAGAAVSVKREDLESRAFHALRIDGLRPATRYTYRVTAGSGTEPGHFTTAPTDDRPFRFLAYGDSRSDVETHGLVVRAMEKVDADFLVNSGDLVAAGNEPDDWRDFFTVEGKMLRDRCLFAAVGNHELTRGDRNGELAFLRYFAEADEGHDRTQLYGSFRWGNTRFFVLNAMDRWTGEEREWLRTELDSAMREPGLAHRIALMHWGPFSAGPHGDNPALASGEVNAIMRDRRVDLVIAGHDHQYERGEGQGLKYIVTGGSGAPLYDKKHNTKETRRFEAAYHFVEVAIDRDKVSITARRPSGGVLEACGYQGSGGWDCDQAPPARSQEPAASVPRSSTCDCVVPGAPGDAGALPWIGLGLGLALGCARRRR